MLGVASLSNNCSEFADKYEDGDAEGSSHVVSPAAHILEAEHPCHECGSFVPVFALLIEGPFECRGEELLGPDDTSALLRNVETLPAALQRVLEARSQGSWRLDDSRTAGSSYFMNHCRECGAKIGDWYVSQPGTAFFPLNDSEIQRVRGYRQQGPFEFESPHLALSSWTDDWLNKSDAR